MTNMEIILAEVITRGITEEVATYNQWKASGYLVKKGEKALFDTRIWKPKKKGKNADAEETADADGEEKKSKGNFYLCKAFFFGKSQVEKIKV